jgi:carbonic anhydrase
VVEEVVRRGVAALESSPLLRERRASGALMIAGAVYDLATGRVRFDKP